MKTENQFRFEIRSQRGTLLSRHHTIENALRKQTKLLNWSKNKKACNADHYNNNIVQIG